VWIKQKPQENGQTRTQERKNTQKAGRKLPQSKLQSTLGQQKSITKGQKSQKLPI
ncbi:hypothetical protein Tco_1295640, partial [Tanacetum coccineum]